MPDIADGRLTKDELTVLTILSDAYGKFKMLPGVLNKDWREFLRAICTTQLLAMQLLGKQLDRAAGNQIWSTNPCDQGTIHYPLN